ncbi:transducin beta-like protein 3 [Protopterus annectens]|uniref:transducin beta-like protein 3 n=1 Tax=Protopterus annectens TaxID=7888 RepID=UPI001CFA8E35|nr:transducin beta-like protein 3 [Protopterus annectens]
MTSNALKFKTNYALCSKIEPFYKGGKVQVSKDGKCIFCTCGTKINVLDITTGKVTQSIEQDDQEDITSFAVSPDDEILVTGSRALLLKQWEWRENKCVRTWKAVHTAPVASMVFDSTSTLLATGGCDSTIKIWDVIKQYCTHNLKGSSGVVHVVEFHPDISKLQLFSSSMDYKIRIWDLKSSKCIAVLESHYSAVTSLTFSSDGKSLVSSGRDKICTVWELKTRTVKRTVPVYESVEAVVILPEEDYGFVSLNNKELNFVTAGSKGILRVWNAASGQCVYSHSPPGPLQEKKEADAEEHSLTYCALVPAIKKIITVTAEHNFILYDLLTLKLKQQFIGYNDEVLDVKFFGPADTHIVVATNSPQLKVFELATSNCQILYGHSETVLALDVFRKGHMFASCAKDNTIRIWRLNKAAGSVSCVAQGQGHARGVGTISCSRMKETFVISGSQDCTVKVWNLPDSFSAKGSIDNSLTFEQLHAHVTEKAHDKDVNSITISPNDKLFATGSQDRTAKLWTIPDCSLLGVFRGHKRGIWCVHFSSMDQVLATSSADGTVKLWSLQDFSCLKTFEGHDASVLKVIFVSRGTQLLTSGSDGLLKLWTIKTNECVKTLDAHEDKVWGLHSNKQDDMVITGSGDSCIALWKDVTEVELAEELAKQEDHILKQQELSNLLQEKKYLKALGLAISLDQPYTALTVIKALLGEVDGKVALENTLMKLRQDQKEAVLRYSSVWNTNSRNCHEAQAVIEVFLKHEIPETLLKFGGIKAALEGLIPYTERHFQRIGRLLQASMFVDFMWQNMRLAGTSRSALLNGDVENMEMAFSEPLFIVDKSLPGKTSQSPVLVHDDEEQNETEDEEEEGDTEDENSDSDSDVSATNKGKADHVHHKVLAQPLLEEFKENVEPSSDSEGEQDSKNNTTELKKSHLKQNAVKHRKIKRR